VGVWHRACHGQVPGLKPTVTFAMGKWEPPILIGAVGCL